MSLVRMRAASLALAVLVGAGCSETVPPKTTPPDTGPFEFGDAPDSTNSSGAQMTAYVGVMGQFPTATTPASGPPGPFHRNVSTHYVLGYGLSLEAQAESGTDDDGKNNIQPSSDASDGDASDDGFSVPADLPHCTRVALRVAVTSFDAGQSFPEQALVNVWIDSDRSGHWGEQNTCDDGSVASEWAVRNFAVQLTGAGTRVIDLPPAVVWNPEPGKDMWIRVSIADAPAPGADGSGPTGGYALGETEDYLAEAVGSPGSVSIPPLRVVDFTALPPPRDHTGGDGFTGPPADLKEVDLAHLGGSTDGPAIPLVVSVVGTGFSGKLSSWTMDSIPLGPTHLKDSPTMVGIKHRLHVLTPPTSPKLEHEMLISGLVRDGTLWLTSWQVEGDGTFTVLDARGYGPNAGVSVEEYAIAHRGIVVETNEKRYQVVTPVLHGGKLRVITWEVNGLTGAIAGRQDSGDVAVSAASFPNLNVVFAEGEDPGPLAVTQHYTVSLIDNFLKMVNVICAVSDSGAPTLLGQWTSGRDIQNLNGVTTTTSTLATAPLAKTGFISTSAVSTGTPAVLAWENLKSVCGDPVCALQPSNISDSTFDASPGTPGVQQSAPTVVTSRVVLRDPIYDDDLFTKNPDIQQATASVRKVMVAVVTLEAVANGDASLDDPVTVSAAAAGVNGKADAMGLQEGEVLSLRDLLYGMLMVSAGDATWAISEHIGGSLQGMLDLMNAKAADLGMDTTFHCQQGTAFSSVSYSTARDQATLWSSVHDDPVFIEFVGKTQADICGTLPDNSELCHPAIPPMTKSMNQYPELDGWKTGGNGGSCGQLPAYASLPDCPSGGCLAVQATRLGRPLIATELQPVGQTPNRWPDARVLFDYGYRQIFTPDFRGDSGNQGGPALNFAIDGVSDTHAVSATLVGANAMRLCNWSPQVGLGLLPVGGCTTLAFSGMSPSMDAAPGSQPELVRLSTVEAEGDYLLGRRENGGLLLQLWRVGQKNF